MDLEQHVGKRQMGRFLNEKVANGRGGEQIDEWKGTVAGWKGSIKTSLGVSC